MLFAAVLRSSERQPGRRHLSSSLVQLEQRHDDRQFGRQLCCLPVPRQQTGWEERLRNNPLCVDDKRKTSTRSVGQLRCLLCGQSEIPRRRRQHAALPCRRYECYYESAAVEWRTGRRSALSAESIARRISQRENSPVSRESRWNWIKGAQLPAAPTGRRRRRKTVRPRRDPVETFELWPDPTWAEIPCKVKGSPYSITERRVPELIPVLGSQPAGDVSHKPGGRPGLQLPMQPLRGLLPILLLGEQKHDGCEQFA